MVAFKKHALSLDEQIHTLSARGLVVTDPVRAKHYLKNISYFRLSAYTRPFYIPGSGDEHRFISGTSFDDVLRLYIFDRELRLLLLDAIERIEVALRAQLTQVLATRHGPHGYLDSNIFKSHYNHQWLISELKSKSERREIEAFLKSYQQKYPDSPVQPPLWMALELLSFKQISELFANLRFPEDQKPLTKHFGFQFTVLKTWFHSLSDLRNHCAHHSRVWNREFGTSPVWPRKAPKNWIYVPEKIAVHSSPAQTINPRRRLYYQLVIIETLLSKVSPGSGWATRLNGLISRNPAISRVHMGFPDNWEEEPLWILAGIQSK
ncbi:Abi family protein [Endozoicomonas sp. 4G]|uniref:Abi family protein n=1 Tax=Endozoicomonas sp. 4G TaxID=2872754 RepID=UPI0020789F8F|nr:Abi family protein [Endozoicomonas sp. 4G]